MENLSKSQINDELRELTVLLNQTSNFEKRAKIQRQIKDLRSSRNTLIANTHRHKMTHERLVEAGKVFDETHKPRVDID